MSFSLMPLQVLMADRVRTAVPGPMAVRVKMEDEGETEVSEEMEGMAAMVVLVAQGGTEEMVAAREVTAVREVTVVTEEMAATKFNHALISLLSWQPAYKTGQNSNYHGLIHS